MELNILTTSLLLASTSFATIKVLTSLITKLESSLEAKKTPPSRKHSISIAISIGAFLILLTPTVTLAQTCPSSLAVQGNYTLRITWTGAANVIANIDSIDVIQNDTIRTTNYGELGGYIGSKSWQTTNNNYTNDDENGSGIVKIYAGGSSTPTSCSFTGKALPIELMYFKGELVNGNTVLTWATASEQNNSHFTVERSTDNVNWTIVNVTNGAGNCVNMIKYNITDYQTTNGTVYYRLRQDDYNGDYTYSNTIAMENNADTEFEIMGMYVENNTLKVSFTSEVPADNVEIQIVSLLGTVQSYQTFSPTEFNGTQVNLDISEFNSGVYSITVRSGNNITSSKFIK